MDARRLGIVAAFAAGAVTVALGTLLFGENEKGAKDDVLVAACHPAILQAREREDCSEQLLLRLLASPDFHQSAKSLAEEVLAHFDATTVTLYVMDLEARMLVAAVEAHEEDNGRRHPLSRSRTVRSAISRASPQGHVADTGRPLRISDSSGGAGDQVFDSDALYGAEALLSVPLRDTAGAVVGVLQVLRGHGGPGAFSDRDEQWLVGVTKAVEPVLERSLREEASHVQQLRLRMLLQAMRRFSIGEGSESVTTLVLECAYRLLHAQRVTVFLLDDSGKYLTIHQSRDAVGIRIPVAQGLAGHVATTGSVLRIPDAYHDPRFDPSVDAETGFRTTSVLACPIKDPSSGAVLGVVQAINRRRSGVPLAALAMGARQQDAAALFHEGSRPWEATASVMAQEPSLELDGGVWPFTLEDEGILAALAGQVGTEYSSVSLLKQVQRSRDTTAALMEVVNAQAVETDISTLLRRIIDAAYRLVQPERLSMFVVDPIEDNLLVAYSEDAGVAGLRLPMSIGLAGWVACNGLTLNVADAYADSRFNGDLDASTGFRTRSVLSVPVSLPSSDGFLHGASPRLRAGRPIAILQCVNKTGGAGYFDREDQKAMESFSMEVALALKRRSVEAVMLELLNPPTIDAQASSAAAGAGTTSPVPSDNSEPLAPDTIPTSGAGPTGSAAAALAGAATDSRSTQLRHVALRRLTEPVISRSEGSSPVHGHRSGRFGRKGARRSTLTGPADSAGQLLERSRAEALRARQQRDVVRSLFSEYNSAYKSRMLAHPLASPPRPPLRAPLSPASGWGSGGHLPRDHPLRQWAWSVFEAGEAADGEQQLQQAIVAMLSHFQLLERFRVPRELLLAFVGEVRHSYRANPFHNWLHAVSVMHATFLILANSDATRYLTEVEVFAVLVAALCHDMQHPGHSNGYEIISHTQWALTHNDDAPLERHHASTACTLLRRPQCNVFAAMPDEDQARVRAVMIGCILGTDMGRHSHHVEQLSKRIAARAAASSAAAAAIGEGAATGRSSRGLSHRSSVSTAQLGTVELAMEAGGKVPAFDRSNPAERMELASAVVHSGDLGGQAYAAHISDRWGECIITEFRAQATKEKENGLPVTGFMANLNTQLAVARLQAGFVGNVVLPLWRNLAELLSNLDEPVENLRAVVRRNQAVVKEEEAKEEEEEEDEVEEEEEEEEEEEQEGEEESGAGAPDTHAESDKEDNAEEEGDQAGQ